MEKKLNFLKFYMFDKKKIVKEIFFFKNNLNVFMKKVIKKIKNY